MLLNIETYFVPKRSLRTILFNLWVISPYTQGYVLIYNQIIEPLSKSGTLLGPKFDKVLKIYYNCQKQVIAFLFGFNDNPHWFQKVLKSLASVLGVKDTIEDHYRSLEKVDKDLRHLQKKFLKKSLTRSQPKRDSVGSRSSISSGRSAAPVSTASGVPESPNLYVEYFVIQYREKANVASVLKKLILLTTYVVGVIFNVAKILFYTIRRKSISEVIEPTSEKNPVKFNIADLPSHPSIENKEPSQVQRKSLPVPVIELTPASPKTNSVATMPQKSSSSENMTDKKRRNSFKDLLKLLNTKNDTSISTVVGTLPTSSFTDLSTLEKSSSLDSTAPLTSTSLGRKRSKSFNDVTKKLLGKSSKISVIEESPLLNKDTFGNSTMPQINMEPERPRIVVSENDTTNVQSMDHNTSDIGSPTTLDEKTHTFNGPVQEDPFAAILTDVNYGSKQSKSVSPVRDRRMSFIPRKSGEHDSALAGIISAVTRTTADKADKDMNQEAYNKLVGIDKNTDTDTEDLKVNPFVSSTPIKAKSSKNSSQNFSTASDSNSVSDSQASVQELGAAAEITKGKTYTHQSQKSTSSVGVKFIHSYTPNLRKANFTSNRLEADKSDKMDAESIDYLTYQHAMQIDRIAQIQPGLYENEQSVEPEPKKKRSSIIRKASLKQTLKRMSGGSVKRKSKELRPDDTHKLFKHRHHSVTSFADGPCTY